LTKQNDCDIIVTQSNEGEINMRAKINIDTMSAIQKFVQVAQCVDARVDLIDGEGYRVSAKSLIGAIATMDWTVVYAECDKDIYTQIKEFVVE
jgi:hypothetical protein